MAGAISLLIDSPLRDLVLAMREVGPEMKKYIGSETKKVAQPIWFEETRGRAMTRVQQRVLVDSARVGVQANNVTLRSGAVGRLSSGTPVQRLASAAEFGMGAEKRITQRSRKGKSFTRRAGNTFGAPRRGGYVVYEAGDASRARIASLWIQTAHRALHDADEKAG